MSVPFLDGEGLDCRLCFHLMSMTSEVMVRLPSQPYPARMSTISDFEVPAVGALLRQWRERRRLSQLQLALGADVSTRHLSYVETGRSHPSPEMIVRLAEHLEIPLEERNTLLLSGGYAPRYRARPLDDPSLDTVLAGLRGLLDAHLPWPAMLLDERWDVVDANATAETLLRGCGPELLDPPINVVRTASTLRGWHPGSATSAVGLRNCTIR